MLNPTRTARISGTTIDSRGQALHEGYVNALLQSSEWGGVQRDLSGQIKADGTFTIVGAAPGTYHIRANGPTANGAARPETLVGIVTVDADDVSGVVLTPVQPATVTGRILFDPPISTVDPSTVRVMATPIGNSSRVWIPVDGRPVVNDDFTFETKASPGGVILNAYVAPGSECSVTSDRGNIVTNATVFVFPQDSPSASRTSLLASTAVARPDQNGRYSIRTRLEPGDYYAVAVDYLDPMLRNDRTYQEELSSGAVRFSIREEESKVLDLKLSTLR